MKNNEKDIRLFKQIAEGFNLTEGEVAETLKLPSEGLKNAIKDCFRQIEQPREKFTAEDYEYLTKELGCVNLEEQLEQEPMTDEAEFTSYIVRIIFDMPLKFTEDELFVKVYLRKYGKEDYINGVVLYTLKLLSHPKVKYLIKDGEYYSLNLNAKIG